jgi:hypothetical protein
MIFFIASLAGLLASTPGFAGIQYTLRSTSCLTPPLCCIRVPGHISMPVEASPPLGAWVAPQRTYSTALWQLARHQALHGYRYGTGKLTEPGDSFTAVALAEPPVAPSQ